MEQAKQPDSETESEEKTRVTAYKAWTMEAHKVNGWLADLNRIGGDIRARKREMKALRKEWGKLHEKVKHVFADPTVDSE